MLSRLTGDGDLERHLDKVLLAPGFSYAEKSVGTNGIGTALEVGGPTHVFGHEHYAENLEDLACAGVPIHHPVTGRLVGSVDLTCWRKDAGSLLLTGQDHVNSSAPLLADASASQLELFQEYLRTCSRTTGIVLALDRDVVMLNDFARASLTPADQSTLLAQAADAMAAGRRGTRLIELSSGLTARMHCRRVGSAEQSSGIVAHVVMDERTSLSHRSTNTSQMPLPSIVGIGPPWLHACQEVERVFRSGEWLVVEGEPGVGKLAVLRAVQLRRQPIGRFELLEARDAATDTAWLRSARQRLLSEAETVVIRHVDELSAPAVASGEARASRTAPPWVAVTLGSEAAGDSLQQLLRLFPSTVQLPPLRLHLEDFPLLVPVFLSRLGQGRHLTCSPEAMRLLMRMSWPGNAQQLHDMLLEVVKHRRSGCIQAEDLPPEVRCQPTCLLEAMERDAIVAPRQITGSKAASSLDVPGNHLSQDPRLRNRAAHRRLGRLTLNATTPRPCVTSRSIGSPRAHGCEQGGMETSPPGRGRTTPSRDPDGGRPRRQRRRRTSSARRECP